MHAAIRYWADTLGVGVISLLGASIASSSGEGLLCVCVPLGKGGVLHLFVAVEYLGNWSANLDPLKSTPWSGSW